MNLNFCGFSFWLWIDCCSVDFLVVVLEFVVDLLIVVPGIC